MGLADRIRGFATDRRWRARSRPEHRRGNPASDKIIAFGASLGFSVFRGDTTVERARFAVFLGLLAACFSGGGGSRDDILSLLYVRPAAVIGLAAIMALPGDIDWKAVRIPLVLLAALAGWTIVQLVPLPPDIWLHLPGREPFAAAAEAVGTGQPWRPISLSPDLTLNSLAALIVPFAALIGFAALTSGQRNTLLPVLLIAVSVSALFAIAQLSSGPRSAFHLYKITNEVGAVGLFANRNHQAALIALAFPMLACWASLAKGDRRVRLIKRIIAAAFSLLLAIMILVTGSRAGLILGVVAAFWGALFFVDVRRSRHDPAASQWKTIFAAGGLVLSIASAATYLAFSRAESLHRLTMGNLQEEQRINYIPQFVEMIRYYFPVGTGMGTFDPVFRISEPFDFLAPAFLNHAHNDLLELVITGGLPAGLLLILFLVWFARESFHSFRPRTERTTQNAYAKLGAFLIFLLLAASVVDYPLRTPVMAACFAIACGWLGSGRRGIELERQAASRSKDAAAISPGSNR